MIVLLISWSPRIWFAFHSARYGGPWCCFSAAAELVLLLCSGVKKKECSLVYWVLYFASFCENTTFFSYSLTKTFVSISQVTFVYAAMTTPKSQRPKQQSSIAPFQQHLIYCRSIEVPCSLSSGKSPSKWKSHHMNISCYPAEGKRAWVRRHQELNAQPKIDTHSFNSQFIGQN